MRLFRFLNAILCFVVISFCNAQTMEHQAFLSLRLPTGDTVAIGRADSAGTLYFSLNDFFISMRIPASVSDSTGKIEGLMAMQLVRFTDRSPFIVITERTTNTSTIYQMLENVFRKNGDYFVSANAFIPLYERLSEHRLTFNAQRTLMLIDPLRSPYSIDGIQIDKKINGTLITIKANSKLGDVESWLKPDGWLFVTIMGAKIDTDRIDATKPFGAVRKVMAFQSPASLQLTFQVTSDVVQAETVNDPTSNDIHISLRTLSTAEKEALNKKKEDSGNIVNFLVSDATNISFKEGAFDVVISFETIEHLMKY
ncbi:MAG: methyltransferase domain-containing protein, partial [Ignavibacteriae bacterium]